MLKFDGEKLALYLPIVADRGTGRSAITVSFGFHAGPLQSA